MKPLRSKSFFQTAYVDVENHTVDAVVVVDADRDPLVNFKSPITYSKTGNLFGRIHKKKPLIFQISFKLYMLMLTTAYEMLLLL